jgi:21S rRNA (GM2251-2'-O)-methyltransferase
VLALDEVWDPQNFGALLRTGYFLGCHKIVVCAKNSAPLSPAVSKASAGAMELMQVYSTDNMMKFLDRSKECGWQVQHIFSFATLV